MTNTSSAEGESTGWDRVQPLAAHEFDQIRQLAHRTFGLDLKSGKEELVSARLRGLVRSGGFHSFQQYYRHVQSDRTGEALSVLIDALATNHTTFLREPEHFEFLAQTILPSLANRKVVDLWSAACSTGEEVWTLAALVNEALPNCTIRMVASDISNKALKIAREARYSKDRCQGLSLNWLSRYFVLEGGVPKTYRVCPRIRAQASFHRVNLLDPYAWGRQFPVIFCRNVMIYFDRQTQEQVVGKLADCLEPGGYLFVGHAESLTRIAHPLEYVRPAVYRKPAVREAKWAKL